MGSYKEIPLVERITEDYFKEEIYPKRKPVVIRGMNIGPCTERWTAEYLMENCSNVNVKVHVCSSCRMDFVNKNFSYGTLTFDTLVHKTSAKDFSSEQEVYYYLRSLGDDPRKEVADIGRQFPLLAQDITVPQLFPNSKFFSSVFRLASPGVSLWTHYDVMDNILIQIKGKKRAVMFPPEDILYLYMKGDKSQVLDIDEPDLKLFPEFSKVTRYERILEPGDIIFIPELCKNLKCGLTCAGVEKSFQECQTKLKSKYPTNFNLMDVNKKCAGQPYTAWHKDLCTKIFAKNAAYTVGLPYTNCVYEEVQRLTGKPDIELGNYHSKVMECAVTATQ